MSKTVCGKHLHFILSPWGRGWWFSHWVVSNSFATPRTITHQAPLSMGFPWQDYWSGLPFPSPGDLPNPGIQAVCRQTPMLQVNSLLTELQENLPNICTGKNNSGPKEPITIIPRPSGQILILALFTSIVPIHSSRSRNINFILFS